MISSAARRSCRLAWFCQLATALAWTARDQRRLPFSVRLGVSRPFVFAIAAQIFPSLRRAGPVVYLPHTKKIGDLAGVEFRSKSTFYEIAAKGADIATPTGRSVSI